MLAGIGQRFMEFCERFGGHFRQRTRTVETSARHYVHGLLQAETKHRGRMEEAIPAADHQALHPMLSASAWSERCWITWSRRPPGCWGGTPIALC